MDDTAQESPPEIDFWAWKDIWLKNYLETFSEIFTGAVSGLDTSNMEGFTDSQRLLFFVCVIFNTIVLMNLLLAVMGSQQGTVAQLSAAYHYRQLVNHICML